MATDRRDALRPRARWLLPVVAVVVVLAVAGGTLAATGVLSGGRRGHGGPSVSPAANGAGGAITRSVVVRPVDAHGVVTPGFVVHDDAAVSCGANLPSYVAVDDGIAWCSPAYLAAVACWPSQGSGSVLCLQDPWKREVVRHPLNGTFPVAKARANPAPLGIELRDGSHCLMRSSGTGEQLAGHPSWTYTYFCGSGQALWAADLSATVDRSAPVWTAQQAPADGQTPPHLVQVAAVYFAGTAR